MLIPWNSIYLKLICAFGNWERRRYSISILKKIANDEVASDRNKRMGKERFGLFSVSKRSKCYPLSLSAEPTRRPFHPYYLSLPPRCANRVRCHRSMSSARYILATKLVFSVVIVDMVGWRWIPDDSFHTDGSRWSRDRRRASFHGSRVSHIFPPRPASLFLAPLRSRLSLREWKGNILPGRPRSLPFLSRDRYVPFSLSLSAGFFFSTSMLSSQPFLPRLQCTLVIRCDEGDTSANMI